MQHTKAICVLCKKDIEKNADGSYKKTNNAEPLAIGGCCDSCNIKVIVKRLLVIKNEIEIHMTEKRKMDNEYQK